MSKLERLWAHTCITLVAGLGSVAIGEIQTNHHDQGEQRCVIEAPKAEQKSCKDALEGDTGGILLKTTGFALVAAGLIGLIRAESEMRAIDQILRRQS